MVAKIPQRAAGSVARVCQLQETYTRDCIDWIDILCYSHSKTTPSVEERVRWQLCDCWLKHESDWNFCYLCEISMQLFLIYTAPRKQRICIQNKAFNTCPPLLSLCSHQTIFIFRWRSLGTRLNKEETKKLGALLYTYIPIPSCWSCNHIIIMQSRYTLRKLYSIITSNLVNQLLSIRVSKWSDGSGLPYNSRRHVRASYSEQFV